MKAIHSIILSLAIPHLAWAAVISYPDFSSVAGLTLNGSAAQSGSVLRLTPEAVYQAGSAFTTAPVTLPGDGSFSTFFSFRISIPSSGLSDEDGPGADGIVFVLQPNSPTAIGFWGGSMGYEGINASLGVEFDTWNNGGFDPNGNHVNFDYYGSLAWSGAVPVTPRLNNDGIWYAWVDYDGATDLLELRLSQSNVRPVTAIRSETVDLPTVFGTTTVYAGFTAATGGAIGNHDILSWEFRYTAIPEPAAGTVMLAGAALAAVAWQRRRRGEQ